MNANPWEHHYCFSFVEALIDAGAVDEAQFVLEKASASGLSGQELTELEARLKPRKMYQQSLEHYLAGRLAGSGAWLCRNSVKRSGPAR